MTAKCALGAGALAVALVATAPARADVIAQTDQGFVSRNVVVVAGNPAAVWKRLVTPSAWWSSDHTFSGDAANMSLDPVPGGCFCERLPAEATEPVKTAKPGAETRPAARGGVQHMRVVFVDRAKALRMVGALGPLQSEAVNATLTITLKPAEGGTRVIFEYVVGGYMRYPPDKIAKAVDVTMGNQLLALARTFGAVAAPASEAATPAPSTAPSSGTGAGGARLDRNGVLLRRGRVWSLPSGTPPAPTPAEPAPNVAPLPTAPLQEDLSPAGGNDPAARGRPAPDAATADNPATGAPDAAPSKPKASSRKRAKPPAPPASPPTGDEPSKDSVNSAFDAAFGGAPRPATEPQSQ